MCQIYAKKKDWFITFKPKYNSSIRLFCFHYAGGGASTFRNWVNDIIDSAEVIAIQLPGREERYCETLLNNLDDIIDNLCINFNDYMTKPFIFFGHSLGALVAFEFARALRAKGMPQPRHLVVSGAKAPQIHPEKLAINALSDEILINELKKYNGVSHSIIENKELISMFLPIIRNDFYVSETYEHKNDNPFSYPITALGGLSDYTFNKKNLLAWKEHTKGEFKYHFLSGDHFFIKKNLVSLIA